MKDNLYKKLSEVANKRRGMEKQLREDESLTDAQRQNLNDTIKYLEGFQNGITLGIQEASRVEHFLLTGKQVSAPSLPKSELVDGYYYSGHCRNASVARWSDKHQSFFHWREKFGSKFIEEIKHEDDEQKFDVFKARERYIPEAHEEIEIPEVK
jgi:hypothetical protein